MPKIMIRRDWAEEEETFEFDTEEEVKTAAKQLHEQGNTGVALSLKEEFETHAIELTDHELAQIQRLQHEMYSSRIAYETVMEDLEKRGS
jgi:hypothetical protein